MDFKEKMDKKIIESFSGLSERTYVNYTKIVQLLEKTFDKKIYEFTEADAKIVIDNFNEYGNISPKNGGIELSKTSQRFYIHAIKSIGNKIGNILQKNQELEHDFISIYDREYSNPFQIMDYQDYLESLKNKKTTKFRSAEHINKFVSYILHKEELLSFAITSKKKRELTELFIILLIMYSGIPVRHVCNLKFSDFEVVGTCVYVSYEEKECIKIQLFPRVVAIMIQYMHAIEPERTIKKEDYVFINQQGNQYNMRNISNMIAKICEKIDVVPSITSEYLLLIADARKIWARNPRSLGAYYTIADSRLNAIEKNFEYEDKLNIPVDERKYLSAYSYVCQESHDYLFLQYIDWGQELQYIKSVIS